MLTPALETAADGLRATAALLVPREDALEVVTRPQRSMGVVPVAGHAREASVIDFSEGRCIRIGGLTSGDAAKPQLLDQTILKGLVSTLDTTFGSWRVRADKVDVERMHRATELSDAIAGLGSGSVHAEDAGFVTVEGDYAYADTPW